MSGFRIYLSPPHTGALERDFVLRALDSGWVAPLGPEVDAFEAEAAARVQMPHGLALASGTAALHLALRVVGVEAGDAVLCSTFTFAATANAIRYCGGVPVFIDSDQHSWNMDPELLAEELERRAAAGALPRAVVCVDLYGQCADYAVIRPLCERYGVSLIEDAAEALGASLHGKPAGSFGDLAILSFNGNKILTTSGGGMLLGRRRDWVDRARYLATQAREPVAHYEHREVGYNYRLSNLLAAVGRAQLTRLEAFVERRRVIRSRYVEALSDLPGIGFMPELARARSTFWLTCLSVDPQRVALQPETLRLALQEQRIEARPVWKPMHLQPAFEGFGCVGGKVSEQLFQRGLCLPSGSSLSDAEQDEVIAIVRQTWRDHS